MGCDIHAFVEVKVKGKWHLFDQPDINRSYSLFGRMAGVRDESQTPIVEPKGLPNDTSEVVKAVAECWDSDGHTHSWFNESEIDELSKWYKDKFEFMEEWGWNITYNDEKPFIEGTRLIFWFDN